MVAITIIPAHQSPTNLQQEVRADKNWDATLLRLIHYYRGRFNQNYQITWKPDTGQQLRKLTGQDDLPRLLSNLCGSNGFTRIGEYGVALMFPAESRL